MWDAVLATLVFWSAFVFSIGPFWIAVMQAAKDTRFATLYKNYLIYISVGWFPIIALIGFVVGSVGQLNEEIYTVLYFVGALVIFRLAWKTLSFADSSSAGFDFNWKVMTILSWSNPKVWTTIPAGFLAAEYSQSLILNIVVFFAIGVPLFLFGVYLWGMIGRQGARLAKQKVSCFNAALLAGFGLYLLYQGIEKTQG